MKSRLKISRASMKLVSRNFCLSRKRRFDELDSFDEFGRHTPIEYSDCEFSNQPPRKNMQVLSPSGKQLRKRLVKVYFMFCNNCSTWNLW